MFKKESDMIENQRKIEYFIQNPNNLLQRVRNKEILPIVAKPLAELLTEKLYALNALTRMRYENQEYMARITLCIDFLLVVELIHSENWLSESLLHYQSRESDLKILQKKYNQFCIIQENFKLIKSSNWFDDENCKQFYGSLASLSFIIDGFKKEIFIHSSNFNPSNLEFYLFKMKFSKDCLEDLIEKIAVEHASTHQDFPELKDSIFQNRNHMLEFTTDLCQVQYFKFYLNISKEFGSNSNFFLFFFGNISCIIKRIDILYKLNQYPIIQKFKFLRANLRLILIYCRHFLNNFNIIIRADPSCPGFRYSLSLKYEHGRFIIRELIRHFSNPQILNTILSYFIPRELNRPQTVKIANVIKLKGAVINENKFTLMNKSNNRKRKETEEKGSSIEHINIKKKLS